MTMISSADNQLSHITGSSKDVRRTKIVATLGPASNTYEKIRDLIAAGLNVTRLNFSHGSHENHAEVFAMVRKASAELGKPVAILQDLQGPKIRLGKLEGKLQFQAGDQIILSSRNDFVGDGNHLPTTYSHLSKDVRPGEQALLADGALTLDILEVQGEDVKCRVVHGGVLSSNKGINLPGSQLTIPSFVEKDRKDLEFGLKLGVDYVALSFVRTPHDINIVREFMKQQGRVVPIISKIEKPEAVEYLESILNVTDGIMIARGDLGVELPPEKVPTIQRRAIRMARERGKQTIVATQMLVSMTNHARPTHAEVSDVANAVFDGTDAVMLSEETAAGRFPVETVELMSEIARSAEQDKRAHVAVDLVPELSNSYPGALSRAAVMTAQSMNAAAIVSFTHRGLSPRVISDWRPNCPIIGFAPSEAAARRMALFWGVQPFSIPAPESFEALVDAFEKINMEFDVVPQGSTVVMTSKLPFEEEQLSNMFKLHTVGGQSVDNESILEAPSIAPADDV